MSSLGGRLTPSPIWRSDLRSPSARIRTSPFIPNKDSVRGFVYEVETGRLREVT